jgi:hypothetical protein
MEERTDWSSSLSVEDFRQLQRLWYGYDMTTDERLLVQALARFGLGRPIDPNEAKAGDFVQFWRGKTGHSVIFLRWVVDKDNLPIGFAYRSSQDSTNGVGDAIEYFANPAIDGSDVDPTRFYVARLI